MKWVAKTEWGPALTEETLKEELAEDRIAREREWRRANGIPEPSKPKPVRTKTKIYFLQCEGFVKIGYATDVYARLADFSIGCPFPQKLLLSYSGTCKEERELHRRFSTYRHRGEWFRFEGALKTFIEEHRSNKICKTLQNVRQHSDNSDG